MNKAPERAAVPSFSQKQLVYRRLSDLRPYARNARTHSRRQVAQIAESIRQFGFTNPVLVSGDGEIIAGHGRVEAARLLGLAEVPTLVLDHLSEAERRAYVLADNKLALNAGWDQELLAIELQGLIELGFEVELTGFSTVEIDLVLEQAGESRATLPGTADAAEPADDAIPAALPHAVTHRGDLWQLGRHRLLCGDARLAESYARLLADERVDLVFTDPP